MKPMSFPTSLAAVFDRRRTGVDAAPHGPDDEDPSPPDAPVPVARRGGTAVARPAAPRKGGGGTVGRDVVRRTYPFTTIPGERRDVLVRASPGALTSASPGAEIPLSPAMADVVAYLRDDTFLVVEGSQTHPIVGQVLEKAAELGRKPKAWFTVTSEELRAVVDVGGKSFVGEDLQRMQKDVLSMFETAFKRKVNDVMIRTSGGRAEVWFCVNDSFYLQEDWPLDYAHTWLKASYNMAQIQDGTYRDADPQAARMMSTPELRLPGTIESIRLQYAPGINNGRTLVARLLMKRKFGSGMRTLAGLGYDQEHVDLFDRVRSTPFGVIFMTGPTGSGKSTTLVVSLEQRYEDMERRINVVTIEDPPEYEIRCATQIPISGVTGEAERTTAFEKAFNSVLRMKPHVIMVGEVRDYAAASLLLKAAMSGHQCWSSIHASSGLAVPSRLAEMGVAPYLIRDPTVLIGLVFQRLLPTLCTECRRPMQDDDVTRMSAPMKSFLRTVVGRDSSSLRFRDVAGCPTCRGHDGLSTPGESGQTVCAEIIVPTAEILDACLLGDRARAEEAWLAEPFMLTAFEHGVRKMTKGLIDPFEVFIKLNSAANVARLRDPERLHAVVTGDWQPWIAARRPSPPVRRVQAAE